jgi:hypothetical protein
MTSRGRPDQRRCTCDGGTSGRGTGQPLFAAGQVVAMPGALTALERAKQSRAEFLSCHLADFVAIRRFEQLCHDNQRRIFKFFRRELPKSNGSYAGYVDYSKLASVKLEGMATATLGKFLMVCAVSSELYCPAYLSSPALGKDSQLPKQAAHYKVNAERTPRQLREQAKIKSVKGKNRRVARTRKFNT